MSASVAKQRERPSACSKGLPVCLQAWRSSRSLPQDSMTSTLSSGQGSNSIAFGGEPVYTATVTWDTFSRTPPRQRRPAVLQTPLRFIHRDQLESEGYCEYVELFPKQEA